MNTNFRDIKNLLKKNTTTRRVWNAIQIVGSYYISRIIKKPIQWGKPISISIEPTTSCNLRCPQCPSGLRAFTRPTGMMIEQIYKQVINELHKTTGYITFYFQGEPYLNKNFLSMVSYANKHKIYTATSTNGHYLTKENAQKTVESGLDRIIISIDGVTQENYSKYRIGGSLEKVLEGTKQLVNAKKNNKSNTPHIIWQFIVFKHNENELEEVKQFALQYEVDELAIKSAQIYNHEQNTDILPSNEKYSRYANLKIKNKLLNHCWRLWSSCVITWDGGVVPCCFDKDGKYQLGKIEQNTFEDIWQNKAYQNFRSQIIKGRKYIDICRNCSEGTSVWKN